VVIAIISTLISSIALAGVAVSLLIQARQLRISQLQVTRAAQFDLLKVGFDRPDIAGAILDTDSDFFSKGIYINWTMQYLQLGHDIKTLTPNAIRVELTTMFDAEFPRTWWTRARPYWVAEATSKRQISFISLIDDVFEKALKSDGKNRESPPAPPSS
jgi:Family of unknown function (DUF6082)